MEKSYDNDGINIYMVLNDVFWEKDNYEFEMLKSNQISYLAGMEFRSVNGKYIPYYNVSGMTEFKSLINMGCLEPDIIINLIKDILAALSGLPSYLLCVNSLVLDEEFIFYDVENKTFCFVYVPGYKENIRGQIRRLLENNMRIMRHENTAESSFVYDLYEKCSEDNFDMKFVEGCIKKHILGRQEEVIEIVINEQMLSEDSDNDDFNLKKKLSDENNIYVIYKVILAVSVCITLFFGAGNVCLQYYKMKQIYDTRPLIGVLILLAVEIFVYFEITRHKEINENSESTEFKEVCENESEYINLQNDEALYVNPRPRKEEMMVYTPSYVLVAYGNNPNEPIYINQKYLIIGRGNNAGYCLRDSSVSRTHAKIYELNNQLVIEDLDSTNGTFVNNYPIKAGYPAVIFPGDVIRFGCEEYRMEFI